MQRNLLEERLVTLDNQLAQKMAQLEEKEKNICLMYESLIQTFRMQLQTFESLKEESTLKKIFNKHQDTFQGIMEEIVDFFEELMELPYKVLVGKKVYEEMDELIADLEDWIETINEELEEVTDSQFAYIEAWDIGVFFEQ